MSNNASDNSIIPKVNPISQETNSPGATTGAQPLEDGSVPGFIERSDPYSRGSTITDSSDVYTGGVDSSPTRFRFQDIPPHPGHVDGASARNSVEQQASDDHWVRALHIRVRN